MSLYALRNIGQASACSCRMLVCRAFVCFWVWRALACAVLMRVACALMCRVLACRGFSAGLCVRAVKSTNLSRGSASAFQFVTGRVCACVCMRVCACVFVCVCTALGGAAAARAAGADAGDGAVGRGRRGARRQPGARYRRRVRRLRPPLHPRASLHCWVCFLSPPPPLLLGMPSPPPVHPPPRF